MEIDRLTKVAVEQLLVSGRDVSAWFKAGVRRAHFE